MAIEVLTKREAAQRVRVSTRYLNDQIKAGVGPAVTTIGRKELVQEDELDRWLRSCTGFSLRAFGPPEMAPAAA